MQNIHAYRAVGHDNKNYYAIRGGAGWKADNADSIEVLVLELKQIMLLVGKELTIDFTPLHDIEYECSGGPGLEKFRLCLPLTPAEIHQFWVHFTETE
jgi:hypothetical protein